MMATIWLPNFCHLGIRSDAWLLNFDGLRLELCTYMRPGLNFYPIRRFGLLLNLVFKLTRYFVVENLEITFWR